MIKPIQSKRGVELSINFIVMLILGIVVFGFGLMMIPKFFGVASSASEELDSQSEQMLRDRVLNDGKVAAYPENFDLKRSGTRIVGLGINNVGLGQSFGAAIKLSSQPAGASFVPSDWTYAGDIEKGDGWYELSESPVRIERNEQEIIEVAFRVPSDAVKGEYTFALLVKSDPDADGFTDDDKNYAGAKLIHITVK